MASKPTGSLSESDYATVREEYDPDQALLSEYCNSGATTIAVIRRPRDTGIEDVCDEWCPELGMPAEALDDYWKLRGEYNRNQHISSNEAANRAFAEANLKERFNSYVRNNADAQEALEKIIRRIEDGEDITLVCFEGDGKECHRHILIDIIEKRREANLAVGNCDRT